ncbi:MAG: hypothetical protein ACK54C_09825 [Betaproteobacteria bacterium]
MFGKIVAPSGDKLVYLVRDNRLVTATAGLDLGEGFRIETISETSISVVYEPLGERFTLSIPQIPR